jgi:hypothetical protein
MDEKSTITRTKLPQGWRYCVWKNGIRRACYESKPLAEAFQREIVYDLALRQLGESHPVTELAREAIMQERDHFLLMFDYGRDEGDYFLDANHCYTKLYDTAKLPFEK